MKKRTVIVAVSLAVVLAGSIAYASTRSVKPQADREPGVSPDDTNLELEMIAALDDHQEPAKASKATDAPAVTSRLSQEKMEGSEELVNTGENR
ncbi:MAG TPA: hypothetical protein VJ550_08045 [Geomonas sp.]|nr:hypothetical protein [Geomonas sp.]